MNILDDLISILDFNAPVKDIRQGVFHTGVLTRHCGLAATLPRDALRQEGPLVKDPGFLLDKTPRDLAQMAYSESIHEAAIGMAAINSLLEVDLYSCIELNADIDRKDFFEMASSIRLACKKQDVRAERVHSSN